MAFVNNTMIIRRDLLTRMASLYKNDELLDNIDRIPIILSKLGAHRSDRCCVHKLRAVAKYKIMGMLGFDADNEVDELKMLKEYIVDVLERETPIERILTVVDEACSGCVKSSYIVTNLCKGCIAHPCTMNCPKDAITRNEEGKAIIDSAKCINCGICKSLCPYHAIIYMPIPCEEVCPVGAIKKNADGLERIDESKCILCGKCALACPFGSIMETTQMLNVLQHIKNGDKVTAILAPAMLGQFDVTMGVMMDAVKKLGFDKVIEVARGANMTTDHEGRELVEKLAEGQPFMTTSCCPSWVLATEKHIPQIQKYVSHTLSPMAYTAVECKRNDPDNIVVFFGPCIAKRHEGMKDPNVDYVMTFEELSCMLNGFEIDFDDCEDIELDKDIKQHGRVYAVSGGVTQSIKDENLIPEGIELKEMLISGLDKKKINLMRAFAVKGSAPANFFEVMSCEGGCIAGPGSHEFPADAAKTYKKNLDDTAAKSKSCEGCKGEACNV